MKQRRDLHYLVWHSHKTARKKMNISVCEKKRRDKLKKLLEVAVTAKNPRRWDSVLGREQAVLSVCEHEAELSLQLCWTRASCIAPKAVATISLWSVSRKQAIKVLFIKPPRVFSKHQNHINYFMKRKDYVWKMFWGWLARKSKSSPRGGSPVAYDFKNSSGQNTWKWTVENICAVARD